MSRLPVDQKGVLCLVLSLQLNALCIETQQPRHCTQSNVYDSQKGEGSCRAILLSGVYDCDSVIAEPTLFSAVCSLACRVDRYDVTFGAGACGDLIAQGLTCGGDFAAGRHSSGL